MKVIGKKDMLAAKEHFFMLMETNIQETGKTINVMVMVCTRIKRVQDMKVIGKMILRVVKVKKHGQKDHNTSDSTKTERKKALENTLGQMAQNMMDNGLIIRLMELVSMFGKMEENIMAIGTIMICTE